MRGNRILSWHFFGVANKIDNWIMACIRERVHNAFRISLNYTYRLRNTETGEVMIYYKQICTSRLFMTLEETAEYLSVQEDICMQQEEVDRPNACWSFVRFVMLDVKTILDQQALRIGAGRLPIWLGRKKGMHALVSLTMSYVCSDAVHQGERMD